MHNAYIIRLIRIYSKVAVALVAAVLTSQLLVREVFLGYTPRVRTDLADRLVERSIALINLDRYPPFNRGTTRPRIADTATLAEQFATLPARAIIPGVYAKEIEGASYTEIHFEQIDWVEIQYRRKNGMIETIKIPRGTAPPPEGIF